MSNWNTLPKIKLGVYPTPFYRLENISRIYNKDIWIKRDDLCGVALGGNKVRKLEYLLADAQKQGCDTVFTIPCPWEYVPADLPGCQDRTWRFSWRLPYRF